MRQNRSVEENDKTYFRSKRIFSSNGYWYFDTREGKQFGPYINRSDAEIELAIFFAQIVRNLEPEESKSMNTSYGNQEGMRSYSIILIIGRNMDLLQQLHGPTSDYVNSRMIAQILYITTLV